ncbi:hypothetical protein J6590_012243 [Homalodisca vitripennis]|nr:hypothetical protein J6590_012243 [Homalodisca vitripennis]
MSGTHPSTVGVGEGLGAPFRHRASYTQRNLSRNFFFQKGTVTTDPIWKFIHLSLSHVLESPFGVRETERRNGEEETLSNNTLEDINTAFRLFIFRVDPSQTMTRNRFVGKDSQIADDCRPNLDPLFPE